MDANAEMNSTVNTSGFIPLGHRLLVEPLSVERTTASGIVLAAETTNKEENAQMVGVVISVGDGCWKDTSVGDWAAAGDKVIYAKYAGQVWNGTDGKKYRIISDLDVVGRVNT